jgi:hypothetical protein
VAIPEVASLSLQLDPAIINSKIAYFFKAA